MLDFKATNEGDLFINTMGDVEITDSIVQAVRIRLRWFLREWRLGPDFGFPWFEDVLVKNPNISRFKTLLRRSIMSVDEVTNVTRLDVDYDPGKRYCKVVVEFTADEQEFREEVELYG